MDPNSRLNRSRKDMAPKQRRKSGTGDSPEQPAKRQKIGKENQDSIHEFYATTLDLIRELREG